MVAVVASGVIGRFLYLQIPRTIEGRALSLKEVENSQTDITSFLVDTYSLDEAATVQFLNFIDKNKGKKVTKANLRKSLENHGVPKSEQRKIFNTVRKERVLTRKIARLEQMKKLFRYWHVAHMPFAIIMLVIVVVHVVVAFTFGYRWIF
jgi:hypothetical protein